MKGDAEHLQKLPPGVILGAPAGVVVRGDPARGPEACDPIPPNEAGHSRARDRGGAGGDLDEAAQRLHHEERLVVGGGAVLVLREPAGGTRRRGSCPRAGRRPSCRRWSCPTGPRASSAPG